MNRVEVIASQVAGQECRFQRLEKQVTKAVPNLTFPKEGSFERWKEQVANAAPNQPAAKIAGCALVGGAAVAFAPFLVGAALGIGAAGPVTGGTFAAMQAAAAAGTAGGGIAAGSLAAAAFVVGGVATSSIIAGAVVGAKC